MTDTLTPWITAIVQPKGDQTSTAPLASSQMVAPTAPTKSTTPYVRGAPRARELNRAMKSAAPRPKALANPKRAEIMGLDCTLASSPNSYLN